MQGLGRIAAVSERLKRGEISARALAEEALERFADPQGEGARAFVSLDRDKVLAQAETADTLRAAGAAAGPLAGIPISIKDLFDVAGEVTRAGSQALDNAPPAQQDAPAIARLRAAGAVLVGRTNMTEFAYSGLGLNPHYGTPGNPVDRSRIPGGSSSGAAVSVTDGMAVAAIGSDTGGSVRIPSALCGLVGFKPTARRVPLEGALPLAASLDSIGPLAPSVACCALLDAIMAGERPPELTARPLRSLRFALPRHYMLEEMDETVAAAFSSALTRLSSAGVTIEEIDFPELDELPALGAKGGFPAAESWHWHRELLGRAGERYDPRVRSRIERGAAMTAADYIDLLEGRRALIQAAERRLRDWDALLTPTVPIVAPRIDSLESDEAYTRLNLLILRNPTVGNMLDLCGISLPCHPPGSLPVGLMLMGRNGNDADLLRQAAAVEGLLSQE
ncbi:amidase [Aquibaculum arenosum]|uniref:Amidase n=1 Tax=Aquibaculum arenosum TaxID=3032591 RepID=A0ABT5YQC4_9PROT|nr:amidase [Fodinicurvata sp. CAU 1616]MDF2097171.1 amidase [Fodinicurvata sp. CAU 1616]